MAFFFLISRDCRVIKQVDYILLILQRVFYSGSRQGHNGNGLNDMSTQSFSVARIVASILS
nr:hypothetical protein [Citrobacter freundii]